MAWPFHKRVLLARWILCASSYLGPPQLACTQRSRKILLGFALYERSMISRKRNQQQQNEAKNKWKVCHKARNGLTSELYSSLAENVEFIRKVRVIYVLVGHWIPFLISDLNGQNLKPFLQRNGLKTVSLSLYPYQDLWTFSSLLLQFRYIFGTMKKGILHVVTPRNCTRN